MSAQVIEIEPGYHFLKIENLMTPDELTEIWDEITFLSYRSKFQLDTNTAKDRKTGVLQSNKMGIWLDEVYSDRKFCNYFKYYQKWITTEARINLAKTNMFWRTLNHCNVDHTLLSYYEDGTYYNAHEDGARLTQLFWIFKDPKKFEGGQLVFTDFNFEIEIQNNTMVFFPGWYRHKVNPVLLDDKTPEEQDKFLCNGRYVISTFYA